MSADVRQLWIIAYGIVQGFAPRLLGRRDQSEAETIQKAVWWSGLLVPVPFALAMAAWTTGETALCLTVLLVAGLLLFGFIFAVNSSVHSYLILVFGSAERITRDVGFYYIANAAVWLIGPLLSGLSFQLGGLPLCLTTAGTMALANWFAARWLSRFSSLL